MQQVFKAKAFAILIAVVTTHLAIAFAPLSSNGVDIYCFHIHVYFMQNNKASVARALELRERFITAFLPENSKPCTHEVTVDRPCVWEHPNMLPAGPHTYGSWGASLPNDFYNKIIPWITANQAVGNSTTSGDQVCDGQHGTLAGILVHPLTADRGQDTRESRKRDHQVRE